MCHVQTTDPKRCDFCHYTPPTEGKSHPADYITAHGKLALANEQDCLRCHHNKAQFCDGCHAKPTPGHYLGDWRASHGQQAVKDRARCLGCHSYEKTAAGGPRAGRLLLTGDLEGEALEQPLTAATV